MQGKVLELTVSTVEAFLLLRLGRELDDPAREHLPSEIYIAVVHASRPRWSSALRWHAPRSLLQ